VPDGLTSRHLLDDERKKTARQRRMLTKMYRTLEMHVPGQWNADGTMYHDDASMPSE